MEQREYFIQVRDPAEVRREILNASKQIVLILQRVERIKNLRARKIEKTAEVRNINKEIRMLINKLKKTMPETGIRVPIRESRDKEKQQKGKKTGHEIKQLEDDLRAIEHKLNLMGK